MSTVGMKTETMCIDSLWRTYTKPMYRCLFVTPYENQVRLIFIRLKEMIDSSPTLKKEVKRMTQNPYMIEWKSGSMIIGFTTGASSGGGGASIRGQRADYIYMDEMDYMGDGDFDTVAMIAAERGDIGMFVSSTPTGRRSKFYECCTNKKMGFMEHYHPSTHNPNWSENMEAEFRAQLSDLGYIHEVLADFGPQASGVFDKERVDMATTFEMYAYDKLNFFQEQKMKELGIKPTSYVYKTGDRAFGNPFRTMGVDFDKYSASSSIVILDFDVIRQKFKVIRRVEVPRGEYSYDNAVNLIVELNDIYNPSWIYCDRGSGEYQIERLHIIGEQRPSTGLRNKVKGWQFKNVIEVMDPVTKIVVKEPMKPFMVNQLAIAFERDKMMLSPFDEVLHKQLIDYEVERISQSGNPVYTSENEHFVDALGLAYLAFVLEFSELTQSIKKPTVSTKIEQSPVQLGQARANAALRDLNAPTASPWANQLKHDPTELKGDRPSWVKVPLGAKNSSSTGAGWGSRGGRGGGGGRSMW
jgi:uncharacterized membrane protein YgcG